MGVAFDRVLIYATGGAAIADVSNTYNANVIAPVSLFVSGKVSHTRVGWTVGGGFDYAINDNWSVGAQYRYSDFGRFTDYPSAVFSPAGRFAAQHHLTENQVQFELSYKFDTTSPIPIVTILNEAHKLRFFKPERGAPRRVGLRTPSKTVPSFRDTVFLMHLSKPAVFKPFSRGAKFSGTATICAGSRHS